MQELYEYGNYNCRFNRLFQGEPSLLMFVQILEQECCYQVQQIIDDVRMNRIHPALHLDITIPPSAPTRRQTRRRSMLLPLTRNRKLGEAL
jgi:hypothetical protein